MQVHGLPAGPIETTLEIHGAGWKPTLGDLQNEALIEVHAFQNPLCGSDFAAIHLRNIKLVPCACRLDRNDWRRHPDAVQAVPFLFFGKRLVRNADAPLVRR